MRFRWSKAGQTANVVAQLFDGIVAVDEKFLLQEVTQLEKKLKCDAKNKNKKSFC